ncbi:MAG: hypothetical protein WCG27_08875, partial [Pseudomonadota bacterium]
MRKRRRMVLMGRDLKLFRFLFEYKVANLEHLRRYLFKGGSWQNVYRRLKKLRDAKYIERVAYLKDDKGYMAYSLSSKGQDQVLQNWPLDIQRVQLRSNSVLHDLELVDIGERLKAEVRTVDYFPENFMRTI